MNNNFGSITWEQVVSHIEKNYKCMHPINGIINIQLYDYQKYMIKQIINGNTLTMTSRQMGVTSVYAWTAAAISQLQRKSNILFVSPGRNNTKHVGRIININKRNQYHEPRNQIRFSNFSTIYLTTENDLPIGTRFDYIFGQFYMHGKDQFEKVMTSITPLSNNINISFNKPKEWTHEYLRSIWADALIQNNDFKAIYLPWYLQTNRRQMFQKEQKEILGQIQFTSEFLA